MCDKSYPKPADKDIKNPVKVCQQDIGLYPARLALTTKALNNLSTDQKLPQLPKDHSQLGEDYELRRLRDGFIYILADKADDRAITANASGQKDWYVYRYYSPDKKTQNDAEGVLEHFIEEQPGKTTSSGSSSEYHFKQYFCFDRDINKGWKANGLSSPYIRLSPKLDKVEIMFSDFELPLGLLDQLAEEEETRSHWMQQVNLKIKAATGLSFPITELTKRVQDFNPEDKNITTALDNELRFTAIGYHQSFDELGHRIQDTCQSGVIVGLDDHIGTMRDVAAYHQYLEAKRQAKLRKYEYAITTAQIIDALARQKLKAQHDMAKRNTGNTGIPIREISFSEAYKQIGKNLIASNNIPEQHLKANGSIIETLKNEFELDDLRGINTINQVANLPGSYGKPFLHIVKAHVALASDETNIKRLTDLKSGLEGDKQSQDKQSQYASALCLYLHGMLWGINQTRYGRQALQLSLNAQTALLTEKEKPPINSAAQKLSKLLQFFTSMTGVLSGISGYAAVNLYSFDTIVSVLVTEIMHTPLKRKAGKTILWEETKLIKEIKTIYRGNGITETQQKTAIETLLNASTKRHSVNGVPARKRRKFYRQAPGKKPKKHTSTQTSPRQLIINDDSYQLFRTASDKLSGASAFFGLGAILLVFQSNTASTLPGKIANDPTINIAVALGELFQPEHPVTRKICETSGRLLVVETKTGVEFASKAAAVRAGLLNFSTALAGIGIALEIGNGWEAYHNGDELDLWGAASRGMGVVAVTAAPIINGLLGMAVTASVLTGIGFFLILIGIGLGLLTKSDIEKWIYNGFWGSSEKYWGEAIKKFEWSNNRTENFKDDIFDKSLFTLDEESLTISSSIVMKYYQIEMQRFFTFADQPIITLINATTLTVHYQGLFNDDMVQAIAFEKLLLKLPGGNTLDYDAAIQANKKGTIKKTFLNVGVASITLVSEKWQVVYALHPSTIMGTPESIKTIDKDNILAIKDVVLKIPHYQNAKHFIEAPLKSTKD